MLRSIGFPSGVIESIIVIPLVFPPRRRLRNLSLSGRKDIYTSRWRGDESSEKEGLIRADIYYYSAVLRYGAKSRSAAVLYGGEENGVSSVRGRIPFTARVGGGEGVQSVLRGEERTRERERE